MRILLVYPGHSFSTIDVARGYQGALQRTGHEVFHIDHHHNLAFYKHAYVKWLEETDPEAKVEPREVLWLASNEVVAKAVELLPLDVIIIITGTMIHPRGYILLKKLNVPIVMFLTESPYLDQHQADLARIAPVDLLFTNDKVSIDYLEQMAGPTYYLPHSWDPLRHFYREVGEEYQHDVFFLGTLFEERQKLFKAINWQGIDEELSGVVLTPMWDMSQVKGYMSNEEVVKHYCGSKIVLNPHRPKAVMVQPYSIGPRTYEAAACGAFQIVSNDRAELHEVFNDVLPTFDGPEDLEAKVRYFLEHEAERKERTEEARKLVRNCTFNDRLYNIVLPTIKKEVLG